MQQHNPFPEIGDYIDSNDGIDLIHYLPFLRLLEEGKLAFRDFDKYSFDELLQIRRVYTLSRYLEVKSNQQNNDDV